MICIVALLKALHPVDKMFGGVFTELVRRSASSVVLQQDIPDCERLACFVHMKQFTIRVLHPAVLLQQAETYPRM